MQSRTNFKLRSCYTLLNLAVKLYCLISIYLVFCKAFDMVPFNNILFKLEKLIQWVDYKVDKLVRWLHPEGVGQWLRVPMDISDKGCLSGICSGTSTI